MSLLASPFLSFFDRGGGGRRRGFRDYFPFRPTFSLNISIHVLHHILAMYQLFEWLHVHACIKALNQWYNLLHLICVEKQISELAWYLFFLANNDNLFAGEIGLCLARPWTDYQYWGIGFLDLWEGLLPSCLSKKVSFYILIYTCNVG